MTIQQTMFRRYAFEIEKRGFSNCDSFQTGDFFFHLQLPSVLAIPPNFADCDNSVASTPCNSILSTDHSYSSDWPDPPENPICSTEDEAGSIITDSGNDFFGCFFLCADMNTPMKSNIV